jgi:hypothetical protein
MHDWNKPSAEATVLPCRIPPRPWGEVPLAFSQSREKAFLDTAFQERQSKTTTQGEVRQVKIIQVQPCHSINFSYRDMQGISMERITLADAPFRGQLLQRFFIVFFSQHAMQQRRLSLGPPRNHCRSSSSRTFSRTISVGPTTVDNQQHLRCSLSLDRFAGRRSVW